MTTSWDSTPIWVATILIANNSKAKKVASQMNKVSARAINSFLTYLRLEIS